jgi:hypothetical protein
LLVNRVAGQPRCWSTALLVNPAAGQPGRWHITVVGGSAFATFTGLLLVAAPYARYILAKSGISAQDVVPGYSMGRIRLTEN